MRAGAAATRARRPQQLLLLCAVLVSAGLAAVGGLAAPVTFSILGEDEVQRRRLGSAEPQNSSAASLRWQRRRSQVEEGTLVGNTEPLGYFYAQIHVGTPGQLFTVIVDTGSSLTAVPCSGCSGCGTHTNPFFEPTASPTFIDGCSSVPNCQSCSGGHCTYRVHYVEGSSISGHLALDQIGMIEAGAASGASELTALSTFGCQTAESGLFRSQLADGIMGLGYGRYNNVADEYVAQHNLRDTVTFCVSRTGGTLSFGADPPLDHDGYFSTPLIDHSRYLLVQIRAISLGSTPLGLTTAQLNSGHGVIFDSGTSVNYWPRAVFAQLTSAFTTEVASMNLGPTTRVWGADCWAVDRAPGGIAAFPTLEIEFAGAAPQTLHAIHYMFSHPSVDAATHFCNGA
jgi:hypothetical protein